MLAIVSRMRIFGEEERALGACATTLVVGLKVSVSLHLKEGAIAKCLPLSRAPVLAAHSHCSQAKYSAPPRPPLFALRVTLTFIAYSSLIIATSLSSPISTICITHCFYQPLLQLVLFPLLHKYIFVCSSAVGLSLAKGYLAAA